MIVHMQEGAIYIIENLENGKGYVGQTTRSVEQRFKEHCKSFSGCHKLRNAIKKYGQDCFSVVVQQRNLSHAVVWCCIRNPPLDDQLLM